jgi:hypothetical protein
MVRESTLRLKKWDKKIDPAIVLQRFSTLKDISKEQLDPYLIQVTGIEKRVKELLEAKGVPTIQIAFYLAYARELLGKTFGSISSETLRNEELAIRSKWLPRGLDDLTLEEIAKMFGIEPKEPLVPKINVLKGVIPTPYNWETNPIDLDKTTDEDLNTHSSGGWSSPLGSSLVWTVEPRKIDKFYVKLEFRACAGSRPVWVDIKLYDGTNVVYSKTYMTYETGYQLIELNEVLGKVVNKVEIKIRKLALEMPGVELIRVYEVKLIYYQI